jgi:hypothetical protein
VNNVCGGKDDMYAYNDFVKATVDQYQWVFCGGIPTALKELVAKGKIEFHHGFDILNYPRMLNNLNVDIVVAPLLDNIFNRCKSNIKFIEMAALGIVPLVQDLTPYQNCGADLRFKDANGLQNLIDIVLKDKDKYLNIVRNNRDIIENGDSNAPKGWWMESNMDRWFKLFCIQQKTLMFDLTKARSAAAQGPQPVKFEV